uniref:Small GTP-binding protein n=1 Tax=uncultured Acetothermia bacterium TaxID=236499 RepID=H5SLT6_9BACT|nr:small GTP-binding protein [uncultured Acetothermia bacterium]BAL57122.1 small GTP-binding protein [uncultured Acetothermia bacterium]
MPANLPPEYIEAELRFRAAKSPEEKLAILRELMALVPKHKGTEKLRVELKRKWTKLQEEVQQHQKKQKGGRGPSYDHIEREGAGQIALVGLPNCGKSSLLAAVTNARPEIAEYPFSTFRPTVGMMPFEDIQLQLIDLPPLSEFTEPWVYSIIRQCDLVALLIDLSSETPAEDLMTALEWLEKARIRVVGQTAPSLSVEGAGTVKRALLLGTKSDVAQAAQRVQELQSITDGQFRVIAVSTVSAEGLGELGKALFAGLNVVRVYTKKPGQPWRKELPYVLPAGSTVTDVARAIHKDLAEKFVYARVWGSAEFPGQRVERTYIVHDGDLLEFHE